MFRCVSLCISKVVFQEERKLFATQSLTLPKLYMPVRLTIVCTVLCLCAVSSYAQQAASQETIDYNKRAEAYRRMKTTGKILTVVGATVGVAGFIMVGSEGVDAQTADVGSVFLAAGNVACAGGIPLWIVGSNKLKEYERKALEVSVKFNSATQRRGLSFVYRF